MRNIVCTVFCEIRKFMKNALKHTKTSICMLQKRVAIEVHIYDPVNIQ